MPSHACVSDAINQHRTNLMDLASMKLERVWYMRWSLLGLPEGMPHCQSLSVLLCRIVLGQWFVAIFQCNLFVVPANLAHQSRGKFDGIRTGIDECECECVYRTLSILNLLSLSICNVSNRNSRRSWINWINASHCTITNCSNS